MKKLKYKQEVVYNEDVKVDDEQRVSIVENDAGNTTVYTGKEWVTFLEALSWEEKIEKQKEEELKDLNNDEKYFLSLLEMKYVLTEKENHASLFGITTEYPDDYYEFDNKHVSFYVFPTKNYDEIKDIFEILSYDLPYTLKEVNNFWSSSFYINLKQGYADDTIRIVLEYKKRAFWLKIKKDNYNRVKEIIEQL